MSRYRRKRGKKSGKYGRSKTFQSIGAAWENETKSGDVLFALRLDTLDVLDWLDAIKFDTFAEEDGNKLSIILLEQTKSRKRGAPDFVAYGVDPVLEEEKEEVKPRRRRARREEPEEEVEPEPEEKPKRKRSRRKPKKEEPEEELDLDFDTE